MNAFSLQPSQSAPPPPGGGQTTPLQGPPPPSGGQGAPAPQGGGSSMLLMLVAFLPVFLFMWWTSRSQQKKQKELESKLKKGDRVVTNSGLVGKLVEIGDGRYIKLEIAPGVKIQMLRTAIAGVDADPGASKKDEPAPSSEKK